MSRGRSRKATPRGRKAAQPGKARSPARTLDRRRKVARPAAAGAPGAAALAAAREQQAATAEILRHISESPADPRPIFDAIVRNAVRLCDAVYSVAMKVEAGLIHLVTQHNWPAQSWARAQQMFPMPLEREHLSAVAIRERRVILVDRLQDDPGVPESSRELARLGKYQALLIVPMMRGADAIGAITVAGRRAFSEDQIALLRTFADQAVIAIENARLFNDTKQALERQTATAEILRVISSTSTDAKPVFEAIVESGLRVLPGTTIAIALADGDAARVVATGGYLHGELGLAVPAGRDSATGIAIGDRRLVHLPDIEAPGVPPLARENGRRLGYRSMAVAPMLREDRAIGAVSVLLKETGGLPDKQLELLKTFADQAVIAIENVRLFNETKEALERQTASAEVLQVISGSLADTQPVFEVILQSCERLFAGRHVGITLVGEDGLAHFGAYHGPAAQTIRDMYPLPINRETGTGLAILERRTLHYPDAEAGVEVPESIRRGARITGLKSVVMTPLLGKERAIGAIFVGREFAGAFSDSEIALIKTFADQAVIAIENARLFNETKQALERQTATAEILKVISESPTDTQPVFDVIAERAMHLCGADISLVETYGGGAFIDLRAAQGLDSAGIEAARSGFPMSIESQTVSAGVVRSRNTVHMPDVLADTAYLNKEIASAMRYRSALGVPMLRGKDIIGVIFVARGKPGLFSEREIALVKTFADQAVIAIENVRLFNETKQALERQTATADILKVISASTTDVQPVFEAITQTAHRLFNRAVAFQVVRDGALHVGAIAGFSEEGAKKAHSLYPMTLSASNRAVRAMREGKVLETTDVQAPRTPSAIVEIARASGFRSIVTVPLLRGEELLGQFSLTAEDVRPRLDDKQRDLLKTFADQAVIAIENVRLFNETRDALEQQRASGEVLSVISNSIADAQPVFQKIVESCERLFSSSRVGLNVIGPDGLVHAGAYGRFPGAGEMRKNFPHPATAESATGAAILRRDVIHYADALDDPDVPLYARRGAQTAGFRAFIMAPLLAEGRGLGAIFVGRETAGPFSDKEIALLKTFADQAVIAIQNARLFNETHEALERQTATAEILKVISESPTEVQPVFDAIVQSGVRLFEGAAIALTRPVGNEVRLAATAEAHAGSAARMWQRFPIPLDRAYMHSAVILDRRMIDIPDATVMDGNFDVGKQNFLLTGNRAITIVPMMQEGAAIGTISVVREKPGALSDKQIALLRTFADQAVIAIQNARLFNETQAALERQTATVDVLRAISASPTDTQPVFDIIAERATVLCAAKDSVVLRYDGAQVSVAAHYNLPPEAREALRRVYPCTLEFNGAGVQAIRSGRVVQIEDVREVADYQLAEMAEIAVSRRMLAVPLLRGGQAIGAVVVAHAEPGRFADHQIELVRTFADQAVIAIENVRLFNETKEALERQTATAEILKVIAGSPTDLRPVFDTIVQRAVRLCDAVYSALTTLDGQTLHLVAHENWNAEGLEAARRLWPMPLDSDNLTAVAAREKRIIHVVDAQEDPGLPAASRDLARRLGYRAILLVPMLHGDRSCGVIAVARRAAFSGDQIALLQTFADQAVIAIENARLFHETREALERQTAISEILRVISASPGDVKPVLDAVGERAARICEAHVVDIILTDGGVPRLYAAIGEMGRPLGELAPIDRTSVMGRAIVDRVPVHVPDLLQAQEEFPRGQQLAREFGHRTTLAVPLLREGRALGCILVRRAEVRPFEDKHIALLQTFADQAAIAIENVRLFNETREALERQKASGEVLSAISSSIADTQPVFDKISESCERLFAGDLVGVTVVDPAGQIQLASYVGPGQETLRAIYPLPLSRESGTGSAILEAQVKHYPDIDAPGVPAGVTAGCHALGNKAIVFAPLISGGRGIGAIWVGRMKAGAFSERDIGLLATFADQAVIAIQNARLFGDTREALERQTATAEILRVISSSPTDLQPVFDAILENALRLCDAHLGILLRYDAGRFSTAAQRGASPAYARYLMERPPFEPSDPGLLGRLVAEQRPVQVEDLRESDDYLAGKAHVVQGVDVGGVRSYMAVPMVKESRVIGAIAIYRTEPRAFAQRQIDLVETFARQAVIAVENARLFKELEARTAELSRSVQQLTALGEVGRAVGASLDLETVLTTIVTQAVRLSGLDGGNIYEYDAEREEFRVRVELAQDERLSQQTRETRLRKGEGAIGRMAVTLAPVQFPDIAAEGSYDSRLRETLVRAGARAVLAVPLLREGELVGGLVVVRNRPGEFSREVVDLLSTFAAQSALAIQNARLFAELEQASRHKSEFLANMSHELRTPLNAIIGYSEMLQEEAADLGADAFVPDLKKINAAGRHLLELINAVLDLSKIEAGKMELYLEDFSVAAMLEDISAVIAPLVDKNANRLEKRWDGSLGLMHADLTKTRQALFNLLSNACKFTERGTVSLEVAREAAPDGDWLAFAVRDTGIGMTPEQMERLFEEFSQADASVTRKFGGTGLGLALSRRLARMMGGDIAVQSEAGRGSTFTLRLPARVAGPVPEAAEAAPAAAGARTVLVIDDEAPVRELMRRFLAREGYRVVAASGGEEGLRLAKELAPDAITLDVMMPGMDGWAVLAALKADAQTAGIPVLMLTIVEDKNLGYALGAADYLTKPIDRDRLGEALARFRRDLPILVVDDDAAVREWLRRILEKDGYAVAEARNGREALARLDEVSPGLILLDLMMPEMDGFELAERLRASEAWHAIPVLVITAKELTAEDRRRLHGSVQRILQKGASSRDTLLREVGDFVAASTTQRPGARKP